MEKHPGHFTVSEFPEMDKRFRTNLINSLSGFKSVVLVGTKNKEGVENLSIISSVIHIGANPALMGFIMRPTTVQRDTYENIMKSGYYTFNHIQPDFYEKAHQTSARYPKEISEFSEVELEPGYLDDFPAPYVIESHIRIGLQFQEVIPIKLNGTWLIIGAVKHIYFPDNCLSRTGHLDLQKAGTITVAGLDTYYKTKKLARLSYAKPNQSIQHLD